MDLLDHVESNILNRGLLREGDRVLVAVSGGLDSMVLLHVLDKLAKSHRWKLTVAHFNHLLRQSQSEADELLVRQTAKKLKLPFQTGRGDVRKFARRAGISLEMAARKWRHDFFAVTAKDLKISKVALAHHADDQVELFFLRLLRGAGSIGLAGMKWENASPSDSAISLVRPFLDQPKDALSNFAQANAIPFSVDATNACLDMQRNRIRNELIPLLSTHYQPALPGIVSRWMDMVGAEGECVRAVAAEWLQAGNRPEFDRLPVAVQRSVLHQQLVTQKIAPDFALVERLRLGEGLWITVDAGRSISREQDGLLRLRLTERLNFNAINRKLSLGGKKRSVTFAGLKINWDFAVDNGTGNACKGQNVEYFDADRVGAAVLLRFWQPGDRFQPIGMKSAKKVQDLFTDLKVPIGERRQRIVAANSAGELFWVEGLRMAEKFKLDKNTVRRLKWSWRRELSRTVKVAPRATG